MDNHLPTLHQKVKVRRLNTTETFEVEVMDFTDNGIAFEGKRVGSLFPDETPFLFGEIVDKRKPYVYDGCMDGTPGHEIDLAELQGGADDTGT
jgi:hypothetical protein